MKKILFLSLALLSLVLLGCGYISTGSRSSSSQDVDVRVGTNGLIAEFARNAPPQIVFEDGKFAVVLRIRNAGAYDIKNGLITFGLEKDYVPQIAVQDNPTLIKDETLPFDIRGKSLIDLRGEENVISLQATAGKLDPQSESKQSTLTATFCYPYKTIASATICIDPDIANIRPAKKVCQVNDINLNRGQGAPIVVRKIETRMVPDGDKVKPQFLIYFENTGQGISVNPKGYTIPCQKSEFNGEDLWNVAYLKVYSSESKGENQLVCTPSLENDETTGILKFRDKKDFIRCTHKDGISSNSDAYTSPIRIEIDYGYTQSISTTFNIQKPLKY
ncbi:hypothetical protein HYX06_03835 [Candidatus Woesearchaeota archaeon]|nr:hypothetical protein [Candidatus Woesearchaeota archaeon]